MSVRLFNELYARKPVGKQISHYRPFFYPLDGVDQWNLIYGPKGFLQYQCVLPPAVAKDALHEFLECIAESGEGSSLAVLKMFGDRPSLGLLSFPRPGVTIALDFPMRGRKTLQLFESLDAIVTQAGGALYPAKDARMSMQMFSLSFPCLESFDQFIDPAFYSNFWRRIEQRQSNQSSVVMYQS